MTYKEVLNRINGLNKDEIVIYDTKMASYSVISLYYKEVRLFDISRQQLLKLELSGYNTIFRML